MAFPTSTPIQYRLSTNGSVGAASGLQSHQALEVRMRSFSRLFSASTFAGVPPQILYETRPIPLNNVVFPLSLRQLQDPLFYIPQLLSTLNIRASACQVIGWKIASYIAQMSAGNRETNFHIVAEVDFVRTLWMDPTAGLYQGQGNGDALVEEIVVRDEAPAMERMRKLKVEENGEELGDCCICLDEMTCNKREVLRTPCVHVYHQSCISKWLNIHNSGPLCKRALPSEDSN